MSDVRLQPNLVCKFCGNSFVPSYRVPKDHEVQFCSNSCSAKARGTRFELTCKQCKKPFVVLGKPSEAARRKFCSLQCVGRSRFVDLTGKRSGKLVAQWPVGRTKDGTAIWLCLCDCGNLHRVSRNHFYPHRTQSCGCWQKIARIKHGQNPVGQATAEYRLWRSAKNRASEKGIPFSLALDDIVIPDYCPVLGVPLRKGRGKSGKRIDGSPSLDRFIPEKGYVPDNISVISSKANSMKLNGTVHEIRRLADWMENVTRMKNASQLMEYDWVIEGRLYE